MFRVPEQYRVRKGNMASTAAFGNNGLFFIPGDKEMLLDDAGVPAIVPFYFIVVASDKANNENICTHCGADRLKHENTQHEFGEPEKWEHISIAIHTVRPRAPYKHEVEFLKTKFWGPEDEVFQYYPSQKFKDDNPLVVHLWRKPGAVLPVPPPELMGLDKKSLLTLIHSKIIGIA